MRFIYSKHWINKRKYRKDITDFMFEYAIQNSDVLKDKHWVDTSNAICRIPITGKTLKLVYKKVGDNKIKIITAFWVD